MKAFFVNLLVISGLLFWISIALAAYLFFGGSVPKASKPLIEPVRENVTEYTEEASEKLDAAMQSGADTGASDEGSPTSEKQEAALRSLGIDPGAVNSVTPEQEACFVRTLGQERVDAIKGGAVPTPVDYVKARECL